MRCKTRLHESWGGGGAKSEQQEQIIIHGTVENLDKQMTNVTWIHK